MESNIVDEEQKRLEEAKKDKIDGSINHFDRTGFFGIFNLSRLRRNGGCYEKKRDIPEKKRKAAFAGRICRRCRSCGNGADTCGAAWAGCDISDTADCTDSFYLFVCYQYG